ncbi:MAG: hypothetical protein EBT03_12900, partial [Betaproteobacteria bacterium]|nr:hypothetical protein [Betaproteobacteria bacterium]
MVWVSLPAALVASMTRLKVPATVGVPLMIRLAPPGWVSPPGRPRTLTAVAPLLICMVMLAGLPKVALLGTIPVITGGWREAVYVSVLEAEAPVRLLVAVIVKVPAAKVPVIS